MSEHPVPADGPVPKHRSAQTAMILGLVGLAGAPACLGLTLFLSPFAWGIGKEAMHDIDAAQGRLGGRDEAKAGYITGIVGTALLVLLFLAFVAFVLLFVAAGRPVAD